MSAQPTGVRKPDRWQVRVSGLTSVVGQPQGGRAGQLQATTWPKQCGRRKQVCGVRRVADDINSLARLEPMGRVGGMAVACDRLTTDPALLLMRKECTRV